MPYRYYDIAEWPLKAKRVALKSYNRGLEGRACFRMRDGRVYEGYIERIARETLVFAGAFGVWDDSDVMHPDIVTIRIADIAALVA